MEVTPEPEAASGDSVEQALDLIVSQQSRSDRNIPSLGTDREVIRGELEEFEPVWTDSLRIVSVDGRVVGAALVDWNVEARKAWIQGPWIDVDDGRWLDYALPLIAAVMNQIPEFVTSYVLTGDEANARLADLAAHLGWSAGDVNFVLAANADVVREWSDPLVTIRQAGSADGPTIRELHDIEFPSTYFSASQLIDRAGSGKQVVLIAEDEEQHATGYAAGRIEPDGEGYIDFVAVDDRRRRSGIGRDLIVALARELLPRSSTQRIVLVVQASREPALCLYRTLGFEIDSSLLGYTSACTPG